MYSQIKAEEFSQVPPLESKLQNQLRHLPVLILKMKCQQALPPSFIIWLNQQLSLKTTDDRGRNEN